MLLSSNAGSSTSSSRLFSCMFLCFALAGCCCQLYTEELMSTFLKEPSYIHTYIHTYIYIYIYMCIFKNNMAFHEGCPAKPCPNLFQCLFFFSLDLLGALLPALLLALWLNWTSSLASSFAPLMQATTSSKCFFKTPGLAFRPFSRSDLVLFSVFANCSSMACLSFKLALLK